MYGLQSRHLDLVLCRFHSHLQRFFEILNLTGVILVESKTLLPFHDPFLVTLSLSLMTSLVTRHRLLLPNCT